MKPHGCGVTGCYGKDSIHHNPSFGGPPFDPNAGQARIAFDSAWIDFRLADPQCRDETRKTFTWQVVTRENSILLGEIKWFGRWRQYAFFPLEGSVYEPTCLGDIARFIVNRMAERRVK